MISTERRRFIGHWWKTTIGDSWAQTFAWPTVISSSVTYSLLHALGFKSIISSPLWSNVVNAGIGFVFALVVCSIVAINKARKIMRPLELAVTDDTSNPGPDSIEINRMHNVAITVYNRSSIHLKDCVAFVMDVRGPDGTVGPRWVEQFDLPPKCRKNVNVAYWCSRGLPNVDDKDINLSGPTGAGFGAIGSLCPAQLQVFMSKFVCKITIAKTFIAVFGLMSLPAP